MFTWDSYRTANQVWPRGGHKAGHQERPLSRFLAKVDHLFYAATLALVICVVTLVVG